MVLWELRDMARNIAGIQEDDVYISESRLDNWINMSYRHIYNKVINLSEDYFLTSTTFSTSNNVSNYTLPTDMLQLRRVETTNGGTELNSEVWPQDLNDVRENVYPERYMFEGDELRFIPKPTGSETIRLQYIPKLTALSASTDTPVIPGDNHEVIAYFAAMQIKIKEESDASGIRVMYNELLDQLVNTMEARQTQRSRQIRYTEDYE